MAHWLYTISAVCGSGGVVLVYCILRAFFLIQGARTDDEQRSRRWFEAARLMRRDAKHIPSYLPDPIISKATHPQKPAGEHEGHTSHYRTDNQVPQQYAYHGSGNCTYEEQRSDDDLDVSRCLRTYITRMSFASQFLGWHSRRFKNAWPGRLRRWGQHSRPEWR
jgi:hypothetical protein